MTNVIIFMLVLGFLFLFLRFRTGVPRNLYDVHKMLRTVDRVNDGAHKENLLSIIVQNLYERSQFGQLSDKDRFAAKKIYVDTLKKIASLEGYDSFSLSVHSALLKFYNNDKTKDFSDYALEKGPSGWRVEFDQVINEVFSADESVRATKSQVVGGQERLEISERLLGGYESGQEEEMAEDFALLVRSFISDGAMDGRKKAREFFEVFVDRQATRDREALDSAFEQKTVNISNFIPDLLENFVNEDLVAVVRNDFLPLVLSAYQWLEPELIFPILRYVISTELRYSELAGLSSQAELVSVEGLQKKLLEPLMENADTPLRVKVIQYLRSEGEGSLNYFMDKYHSRIPENEKLKSFLEEASIYAQIIKHAETRTDLSPFTYGEGAYRVDYEARYCLFREARIRDRLEDVVSVMRALSRLDPPDEYEVEQECYPMGSSYSGSCMVRGEMQSIPEPKDLKILGATRSDFSPYYAEPVAFEEKITDPSNIFVVLSDGANEFFFFDSNISEMGRFADALEEAA